LTIHPAARRTRPISKLLKRLHPGRLAFGPEKESAVRRVTLCPSNQPKRKSFFYSFGSLRMDLLRQPIPCSTLLPTLLQAITLMLSLTVTSDLSLLPSLLPKLPTSLEGLY
jgi:hypothetical protein